jgi:type IV secretion system protein TrbG
LFPSIGSIMLSPTALEAIRVSQEWQAGKAASMIDSDGRVIYRYGCGLPTVVCAPLRVCTVELQPGEHIQGDFQIGDKRWNVDLAKYGAGDDATPVIVLKPTQSGLDTNLVLATDRRAYYVRLISEPDSYLARVGFSYPDDDAAKWRAQVAAQKTSEVKPENASLDGVPSLIAVEKMHFNYRVSGGNKNIRPVRVFDDGVHVYMQMPEAMLHREAPELRILGQNKKSGDDVNYRVQGQLFIVDELFEHAQLRLGTGKHAQKVDIRHG